MRNTTLSGVVRNCRRGIFCSSATLLFTFYVLAFFSSQPVAVAQDSKSPSVLPAPSAGKAIVCIYRVGRFTGSAAHDELYINDTHLAKLLNSDYAFMEIQPGTVVISGLPTMYSGGISQSTGAALA